MTTTSRSEKLRAMHRLATKDFAEKYFNNTELRAAYDVVIEREMPRLRFLDGLYKKGSMAEYRHALGLWYRAIQEGFKRVELDHLGAPDLATLKEVPPEAMDAMLEEMS